MSRLFFVLICISMALASSCVPSIHGIYSEDVAVVSPILADSWVSEDDDSGWEFLPQDDGSYLLTIYTPDEVDSTFNAWLVELEGELFLDIFPSQDDDNWPMDSFYGLHFYPVHTFMHVTLEGDTLGLGLMDPSFMAAWLMEDPTRISHETNEMSILTASTEQLQEMLPMLLDAEPIPDAGFMGGDALPFLDSAILHPGVIDFDMDAFDEAVEELENALELEME